MHVAARWLGADMSKTVPKPSVEDVSLDVLTINLDNPRIIDPDRLEALKASLKDDPEMLRARPVIADNDGNVIAGNMRLQAAKELGWKTIPTIKVSLDDKRARLWMLKDNQQYGDWIDEQVGAILKDLEGLGANLELTGFRPEDIDELLGAWEPEEEVDVDDVPDPPEPTTKPGDVWELGNHVVACGDARDEALVGRLLAGQSANLVWTDPPYGVDYEGKTSETLRVANDDLGRDAHELLLEEAFAAALAASEPGAVWYVCAPSSPPQMQAFLGPLERLGIWQQTLVWVKDTFVLGRADFHYRHELMLYGWSPGDHRRPPGRSHDTVWEVPRPRANRDHPTAKPVALVEGALKLSSRPGDLVLDPFIGSGTTLIAAHRARRRCVGIDIDPRYVDVTVARYEHITKEKAVRRKGG